MSPSLGIVTLDRLGVPLGLTILSGIGDGMDVAVGHVCENGAVPGALTGLCTAGGAGTTDELSCRGICVLLEVEEALGNGV